MLVKKTKVPSKFYQKRTTTDEEYGIVKLMGDNFIDLVRLTGTQMRIMWVLTLEFNKNFVVEDLEIEGITYLFIRTSPQEISEFLSQSNLPQSQKSIEKDISDLFNKGIIKYSKGGYIIGKVDHEGNPILFCEEGSKRFDMEFFIPLTLSIMGIG